MNTLRMARVVLWSVGALVWLAIGVSFAADLVEAWWPSPAVADLTRLYIVANGTGLLVYFALRWAADALAEIEAAR